MNRKFNLGLSEELNFIWCPPGEFKFGSATDFIVGRSVDIKRKTLEIKEGFLMAETPVTRELWDYIMPNGTIYASSSLLNVPVEPLSFDKALYFCQKMTQKCRELELISNEEIFYLPTEQQWEYACRANTNSYFSFGDDENELEKYGWFKKNSNGSVHPVKQKTPNPWGLYDMHGNVYEICINDYDDEVLEDFNETRLMVVRGGCYPALAHECRSASRCRMLKVNEHNEEVGIRLTLINTNYNF